LPQPSWWRHNGLTSLAYTARTPVVPLDWYCHHPKWYGKPLPRLPSPTADSNSTSSTVPNSPYACWELVTVPPRPTIHSNRVGLEADLPLTRLALVRLPVHNSQTVYICFRSSRNVLDPLRYIVKLYIHSSQSNCYSLLHLRFRDALDRFCLLSDFFLSLSTISTS
jgi:hypothetical protein